MQDYTTKHVIYDQDFGTLSLLNDSPTFTTDGSDPKSTHSLSEKSSLYRDRWFVY